MTNARIAVSRRALLAGGMAMLALPRQAGAGSITDAAGQSVTAGAARRIVSIGSSVTELLVDLKQGQRIVAVDSTSASVDGVQGLPDVGYLRALPAEGILAQSPDLIIATSDAGPPEVLVALRQSGIPLALIAHQPTVEGIVDKALLLGRLLDCSPVAEALAKETRRAAADLAARVARYPAPRPRVLFILSFADGRLVAGGAGTGADSVIGLAGGENVARGMTGYKPLSAEVLLAEPPDAIVTMRGEGISPSADAILAYEPLADSPAARRKAIRAYDGTYLLGFGPRTLAAAAELAAFIHDPGRS